MADDKTKAAGPDRTRISFAQDQEARDWPEKFGVTPGKLKSAIEAVGNEGSAVEAHLKGAKR